jgi:hypothetical protein
MPKTHIFRHKSGRTTVHVPSFLRDMFDLQNREEIDITTDGKLIILTPQEKK